MLRVRFAFDYVAWQVLMPHSTGNGLNHSQKRFRRVAALFTGIVVSRRATNLAHEVLGLPIAPAC